MAERSIPPVGWIIPESALVWICEQCGIANTSPELVPVLPPAYELSWLCDDCYRSWKHGGAHADPS